MQYFKASCIHLSKTVKNAKTKMAQSWIDRRFETSNKLNFIHHTKAFPKYIHFLKSVQNCKSYRANYKTLVPNMPS
jgi:CRISPR/Cas system CSM-associated protein Csm4 (group 5 of RAMP superfamily)